MLVTFSNAFGGDCIGVEEALQVKTKLTLPLTCLSQHSPSTHYPAQDCWQPTNALNHGGETFKGTVCGLKKQMLLVVKVSRKACFDHELYEED